MIVILLDFLLCKLKYYIIQIEFKNIKNYNFTYILFIY